GAIAVVLRGYAIRNCISKGLHMKAVILAGGFGSRLSEETALRPKPMVEIGGRPILWHIMKTFAAAGVQDFLVCCGYKGYLIKEYFANYALHQSDVTIDLALNSIAVHSCKAEPWKVTLVDTGEATMTGGRLLRVAALLHLRRRRERRRPPGAALPPSSLRHARHRDRCSRAGTLRRLGGARKSHRGLPGKTDGRE